MTFRQRTRERLAEALRPWNELTAEEQREVQKRALRKALDGRLFAAEFDPISSEPSTPGTVLHRTIGAVGEWWRG